MCAGIERLLQGPAAAALGRIRSLEVQFHLDWGAQKDTKSIATLRQDFKRRAMGWSIATHSGGSAGAAWPE